MRFQNFPKRVIISKTLHPVLSIVLAKLVLHGSSFVTRLRTSVQRWCSPGMDVAIQSMVPP